MSNKKAETWSAACLASVVGAHRALTFLYDGLETDDKIKGLPVDCKSVFQRRPTDSSSVPQGYRIFTQHCHDLCVRLSCPTEGRVRLPLGAVLHLVSRCLQVTFNDVRSIPSLQELSKVLPGIHGGVLDLLAHLILCCGSNLLSKSRQILDACLQVLTSTEKMEENSKGELRARVYTVLSLWLETAGLGKHYLSKVKDFHRELIADIDRHQTSAQVPNGNTVSVSSSEPQAQRKKGKGKKKGSRRAESYLDSSYANSTQGTVEVVSPQQVAATRGALHVSQLVAERGQFVPLQALMRSVVDTALDLQRQPPHPVSPYTDPECRSSLYRAVFALASVPLECTTNTLDTVAHFQLTSRALGLVGKAGFTDPSIVTQQTCRNLVSTCRAVGLLNRPIVRKVLPEEQVEMRDVAEMDRQMDDLREENERLKSKVLAGEVENQRQTREAGDLREELERLRKATVEKLKSDSDKVQSLQEMDTSQLADPSDSESAEEESEGIDTRERNGDEEEGNSDGEKKEKTSEISEAAEVQGSKTERQTEAGDDVTGSTQSPMKSDILPVEEIQLSRKEKRKLAKKNRKNKTKLPVQDQDTSNNVASSTEKRPISSVEEASAVKEKKSRLDPEETSVDVQDMLLDFVDADPDSD